MTASKTKVKVLRKASKRAPPGLHYYDPSGANWRRVKKHLNDPEAQAFLVRDMNLYLFETDHHSTLFEPGNLPARVDEEIQQFGRRGRRPAFHDYVSPRSCHWTVNFSLRIASLVEPHRPWRILTSICHSTIWDGDQMIWDWQTLAKGFPATGAWDAVFQFPNPQELPVKRYLTFNTMKKLEYGSSTNPTMRFMHDLFTSHYGKPFPKEVTPPH